MFQVKYPPFQVALKGLLEKAKGKPLEIKTILKELAGRGYPALLVLIGIPFCIPIQIPGLSTPFGLLLAFLGLRIAFGRIFHWPKWLLDKQIPYATLEKIVAKVIRVLAWSSRFLKPRLVALVQQPWLHIVHGLTVFVLSLILALPLPIPLTNLLTAFPIVMIGMSLLEDDGVLIILAYLFVLVTLLFFVGLFYLGYTTMNHVGG